jgi:hypothetical protein
MVELTTQSFNSKIWVNPTQILTIIASQEGSSIYLKEMDDPLRVTETPAVIIAQIVTWARLVSAG